MNMINCDNRVRMNLVICIYIPRYRICLYRACIAFWKNLDNWKKKRERHEMNHVLISARFYCETSRLALLPFPWICEAAFWQSIFNGNEPLPHSFTCVNV